MDDTLQTELDTYLARLPEFSPHEGEYVVIRSKALLGFYPDYEAALEAGFAACKQDSFFVKRVALVEETGFIPVQRSSNAQHHSFEEDSPRIRTSAAR